MCERDSGLFIDRIMSQEELAKILNFTLGARSKMSFAEFKAITEGASSAIFLCVTRSGSISSDRCSF